jgi:ATP-dependent helicase/nuclease subunit A
MKWTKAQHAAIYEQDKNILVSAGAGSGKTAVLSERVVEKIRQGVPVDHLVVLTFTNAAAKEMKIRIRKKLQKDPSPHAKDALEKLDSAHIQTFDSYALFIVKKYGYLKNLSKQITIGDPIRMQLAYKHHLDAIFLTHYENNHQPFLDYIDTYAIKDDATLKEQILYFYTQLGLFPDFHEALTHYTEDMFTEGTFETTFKTYETLIKTRLSSVKDELYDLDERMTHESAQGFVRDLIDTLAPLFNAGIYDLMFERASAMTSLPTLRGISRTLKNDDEEATLDDLKAARETIKKLIDKDILPLLSQSKDAHFQDFMDAQAHIPVIKDLLKSLYKTMRQFQFDNEIMDFSTIARLAIELVRDNPSVKEALSHSIHEVMIDEYQDTSKLQDTFIALITNHNTYQVGDVKQSIYRFRHAEPSLFTKKYKDYQTDTHSMVIDLNANFRSRQPVLDDINTVFQYIMDESVGGIDYEGNQRLTFGNTTYDTHHNPHQSYGLEINPYTDEDVEDYLKEKSLSLEEMEFFYIADDILKKVGSYDVFDSDLNTLRKARYDDFAILISVSSQFDAFKQIFEYKGIPLTINKNEPFLNYVDIDAYRNLFKLLYALTDYDYYKKHAKHAFLSVARSYLFDFNDDQIITQLNALPHNTTIKEDHVLDDFTGLFWPLFELRDQVKSIPLNRLFKALSDTFDFHQKTIHLPHTKSALARLDYLTRLIHSLTKDGYTLAAIVEYFDHMVDEGLDVEFASDQSDADGKVQMMTIHKSKGLEFPIVYLPSLHRMWNRSTMKNYAFSETYGMLMPHDADGLKQSYLFELHKDDQRKDDTSERLRVLYVALTRIKEKGIIPLYMNTTEKHYHYDDNDRIKAFERSRYYKHFNDVFKSIIDNLNPLLSPISLSDYDLNKHYKIDKNPLEITVENTKEKTYQAGLTLETHSSKTRYSKEVTSLLDQDTLSAIEKGNTMHVYFELINFFKPIEPQINRLTDNTHHRALLKAFFNTELMQSLSPINVYKEFPFYQENDQGQAEGYMDLLIETDTQFIIVDFKLKTIDKDSYRDQIQGYASLLKTMTSKPIKGYLYSIIDKTFLNVV